MKTEYDCSSAEVLQAFAELPDPRSRTCAYPLDELLLVALSAITSGAEDWVNVVEWAQLKLDWLRRWLPFENGIASHDTFSRVFSLLDAQRFEACFIGCTIRTQLRAGANRTAARGRAAAQWNDMTDLQRSITHNDALDDELQERLLVGKRRLVQARADVRAERLQVRTDSLSLQALLA